MIPTPLKSLSGVHGKPPLFLVHPFTGNITCYLELADRLKSNFTVFGLQAAALEETVVPATDVESLATYYLKSILQCQGQGAFILCGWSVGGSIALEIARQLQKQGHCRVHVTMLDTWRAKVHQHRSSRIDGAIILALISSHLELGLRLRLQVPWAALLHRPDEEAVRETVQRLVTQGSLKSATLGESVRRLLAVSLANIRASLAYQPENVNCSTTLFRAEQNLTMVNRRFVGLGQSLDLGDFFFIDDESNGWDPVCKQLSIRVAPASHYSILAEPSLSSIATYLSDLATKI